MKKKGHKWPNSATSLAIELHDQLRINDRNWHELKGNSDRRAAELLSGAMVQLLSGGKISDVEVLINQSILWLNKKIKDPGCPGH